MVVCVVVVILLTSYFLIYPAKAFDRFLFIFCKARFSYIYMHEFENIVQKLLTKTFGFHLASCVQLADLLRYEHPSAYNSKTNGCTFIYCVNYFLKYLEEVRTVRVCLLLSQIQELEIFLFVAQIII